ncbi:MAG TPA: tetratricopeptide repeat protein [Bacteroidales bacterium]
MDFDNLIKWLKNPDLLNRESLSELRTMLDEYPCFAILRLLYLKNLLVLKDLRFSKELILTAISVPDRRRLYYFIEDKPMPESLYSHEKELFSGEGFSIIDRFLHLTADKSPATVLPVDLNKSDSMEPDVENIPKMEESQDLSAVSFSPEESSFSLDYVRYMDQTSPTSENPVPSMPGQELIDAFLDHSSDTENRIARLQTKSTDQVDAMNVNNESSTILSEEITSIEVLAEDTFTETLAKIYLKQKRYDRALEIFKSLSLKYPEKNVYFADQIRYLEKLIINIKK